MKKPTGTHTGSFIRDTRGIITRAMYYHSKWDKELGESINVEGKRTIIEVIGTCRNNTIDKMNDLINASNKKIKESRITS